ncbi:hypothetical protein AB0B15_02915 [Streptomyces sp. NPDC045456]|uniref:hypothetical protein n=1 Tax=Streptomyces sp. NPDC045456 TaxID=3155254 RepID=UPI0033FD727C
MNYEDAGEFHDVVDEVLADVYAQGTHYDAGWLRENAVKTAPGKNPPRKIVVDLGLGDSVDRLDSSRGVRLYGPQSVEVIYWPDGGIDQRCYELGKAPEMPRATSAGRYLSSKTGRQTGTYVDKTTYEFDGEHKTLRQWYEDPRRSEEVSYETFRARVKGSGWPIYRALTEPVRKIGRKNGLH